MNPAVSEDGRVLTPIGTRSGRRKPDYCRTCGTVTSHWWVVDSHEWWDCAGCGERHFSEAYGWACVRCGDLGDGWNTLLTLLARAGLEPEPVDG